MTVELRFARAADIPLVRELTESAHAPIHSKLANAVTDETAGGALRIGLNKGQQAFTWELARLLHTSQDLIDVFIPLSLVLVADHPDYGVIGALTAGPPSTTARTIYEIFGSSSIRQQLTMALTSAIAKVEAVATAPTWQGLGAGSALLAKCSDVYARCDYRLLYGFTKANDLDGFYLHNGFDVFAQDEHLDLWPILGVHIATSSPHPGEHTFARWLNDWCQGEGPVETSRRVVGQPSRLNT